MSFQIVMCFHVSRVLFKAQMRIFIPWYHQSFSRFFSRTNNHHFMWPYYLALCVTANAISQLMPWPTQNNSRFFGVLHILYLFFRNALWKPKYIQLHCSWLLLLGPRYFMVSIAKNLNQTPKIIHLYTQLNCSQNCKIKRR